MIHLFHAPAKAGLKQAADVAVKTALSPKNIASMTRAGTQAAAFIGGLLIVPAAINIAAKVGPAIKTAGETATIGFAVAKTWAASKLPKKKQSTSANQDIE
jgi:hypothetical protein